VFKLKVGVGKLFDVLELMDLCICGDGIEDDEDDAVEEGRDFLLSGAGGSPMGERYG
jgi:hypothetical protein